MLTDGLTKLGTATMLQRLVASLAGDLHQVPEKHHTIKPTDATWWAAAVIKAADGGGDGGGNGDPERSACRGAVDSKGDPEPKPGPSAPTNQTKKRRRGQKRTKVTGDQREKRRKEDPDCPDWGGEAA